MFEWHQTLYSQYANSPVILAMLDRFSTAVNPKELFDRFYSEVWNIPTATTWGLDVWGRIVGVQRVIAVSSNNYFGFNEAGTLSSEPFGQAPFYPGYDSIDSVSLDNNAFRQLIYAKCAANIWDGSIPGYNLVLRLLFPSNAPYIQDNQNMTMTIVLGFTPTPVQQAILFNTNVLPRPTAVAINFA